MRPLARLDVAQQGVPPFVSILDCELRTGRTHQIRVHLSHAGFPILGDAKYGDFALNRRLERLGLKRMFLHAHSVAFAHPANDLPVRFEAPAPEGFAALIEKLGDRPSAGVSVEGKS